MEHGWEVLGQHTDNGWESRSNRGQKQHGGQKKQIGDGWGAEATWTGRLGEGHGVEAKWRMTVGESNEGGGGLSS